MSDSLPRYDTKTKDTYGRGWAVNRILERLRVPLRDALFLVLAGEGRDRQKLLSRKAPNHNIISVDKDQSCVDAVRADGGIAVCADVGQFLLAWAGHLPFDGLMLDFNCGLEKTVVVRTIEGIASPAVQLNAPIYVNFQRGRDSFGRLAGVARIRALHSVDPFVPMRNLLTGELQVVDEISAINRAVAFVWQYCNYGDGWESGPGRGAADPRIANPIYGKPYRQRDGGVFMDGAVFNKVVHMEALIWKGTEPDWLAPMRRKVAAALAVRTQMRKRCRRCA